MLFYSKAKKLKQMSYKLYELCYSGIKTPSPKKMYLLLISFEGGTIVQTLKNSFTFGIMPLI